MNKYGVSLNIKYQQFDSITNFINENHGEILSTKKINENLINIFVCFSDEERADELKSKVILE